MKKRWMSVLPVLIAVAGGVTFLAPMSAAQSDDQGTAALTRAAVFLSNAQTFRVQSTVRYEIVVGGETEAADTVLELALRRPKDLSLNLSSNDFNIFFVADEKELNTYIPSFGKYTVEEGDLEPAAVVERAGYPPIDSAMIILAELVKGKPFSALMTETSSITHEGVEEIDGVQCDRIRITTPDSAWDLWIDTGNRPLIRKVETDTAEFVTQLKEQGIDMKLTVTMALDEWKLDDAPDTLFAFNPPADAQKVDSFTPPRALSPAEQMVGEIAPPFSVDLMDGGRFEIANKGPNDVVILDFWATWCGPCRGAMPILSKVSKEFASQGVRLFAMNLREETSDIKKFLQSQRIDVTVGMDREGAIATKYRVEGIPQTVIIGQDGTIQVVHVGLLPNLEEALRADLAVLVKGESIVKKTS